MKVQRYFLVVPLLFALGLGIGTVWRQHATATHTPDFAAIMSLACASSSTGAPRPGLHEHEQQTDTAMPDQIRMSLP